MDLNISNLEVSIEAAFVDIYYQVELANSNHLLEVSNDTRVYEMPACKLQSL